MLTKKGCKEDNVPEPQFKVHPGDIMIRFTAPKGFALGAKDDNHVTQNDKKVTKPLCKKPYKIPCKTPCKLKK
ncbi:MAG: hypothetical protein QM296_06885 [Bacillota bacterium]|nr:hypothetical protein [Bacillota bacterium]